MVLRSPILTCPIRAARRRLAGEEGFTIIEVMVSAVILAIATLGTLSAFDSANATSGRNEARSVAAQLAQTDQERLRAMTPQQLANLADASQTQTKTVNGRNFTVVSSSEWLTDPSSAAGCGGMGKEAGYQQITSNVSWPKQASVGPVEMDSIKAVQNGGYKDTRGSLALQLLNGAGGGTANVAVTITGPRNYSATTNANGCVLLGFVPVGAYTLTVNQPGYVQDLLPNAQSVSKTVQVTGGQTGSVSFNYDQAGSLGVAFKTRVPGAGADINTTGDGFTVANAGLGAPGRRSFGLLAAPFATAATGAGNGAVPIASAQKVLYPFAGGYGVWAGTCAESDPALPANGGWIPGTATTQSGNASGVVPANGAVTNVAAFEPMIKVTVNKYTDSAQTTTGAVTQAARVLVTPAVSGCANPYAANTATNGTIADASQPTMPYGSYIVCAQDKTTSPTKRVVVTVANNARLGKTQTLTLPFGTTTPAAC